MNDRYDPLTIAFHFLTLAHEAGVPMRPLKLQKLVYYAAGWYAGYTGLRLLNEEIKAWENGPVIASIYDEFRQIGNDLITCRDVLSGLKAKSCFDDLPSEIEAFLAKIWESYRDYSDSQLSSMTKAAGTPWDQTLTGNPGMARMSIPFEVFESYFKGVSAQALNIVRGKEMADRIAGNQTVRVDLQKMRGDLLKWALPSYAGLPVVSPLLEAMGETFRTLAKQYQGEAEGQQASSTLFSRDKSDELSTIHRLQGKREAFEQVVIDVNDLAGQHFLRARLGEWVDVPLEVVEELVGKYDLNPDTYWKHIEYRQRSVDSAG